MHPRATPQIRTASNKGNTAATRMVAGTIKHAASGRCFANKHWRSGQSPDRKDAVAGIVMATASYLGSLMRANKLKGRWRRRETKHASCRLETRLITSSSKHTYSTVRNKEWGNVRRASALKIQLVERKRAKRKKRAGEDGLMVGGDGGGGSSGGVGWATGGGNGDRLTEGEAERREGEAVVLRVPRSGVACRQISHRKIQQCDRCTTDD